MMHLNRVTEVIRSNGTKTEVSFYDEDHTAKDCEYSWFLWQSNQYFMEYKYNDQGYVVGETATGTGSRNKKDAKLGRLGVQPAYCQKETESTRVALRERDPDKYVLSMMTTGTDTLYGKKRRR